MPLMTMRLRLAAGVSAIVAACSQAPAQVDAKVDAPAIAAAVGPTPSPAPAQLAQTQTSAQTQTAQQAAARAAIAALPRPEPLIKGAHWHHFHINAVEPKASISYYTQHFDAKPANFAGMMDAVWTQKSWILFNKVNTRASTKLNTAIWHVGWGAPDPKAEFKKQTELDNTFFQPITDISTGLASFRPDTFYYMYVESPDRTLIELNTARHDNFGHMHMFSADPIAAGDWYIKFFGVAGRGLSTPTLPSRAPRMSIGAEQLQVGPSSSLNFDNVNMIIYPVEYAKKAYAGDWVGITELQTTRGNVNDHFGVSVPNLDEALKVFRANGVKVTQEPRDVQGKFRFAFIEGPDKVAIELIEDHTEHPPEEQ